MKFPEIVTAIDVLRIFKGKNVQKVLAVLQRVEKPLSVTNIIVVTKLEQSIVSGSLALLRKNGFVNTERHGKWIYYSINQPEINRAMKMAKGFEAFREKTQQLEEVV